MRTERVMAKSATSKKRMQEACSTLFAGRAIAGLAADPSVIAKTGQVFSPDDLQDEYGFQDE